MHRIKRVLVSGGGIGGMTVAAFLAQRGVEVSLIERRPTFDIPGIGLGQPANALRVYDALGVLDEVLATGFRYDAMRIFDAQRRLIVEHAFRMGDARHPPFCALSRNGLHAILQRAARRAGVSMRLGTMIESLENADQHVDVQLSDGSRERADLVIGFDGIRSAMRRHIYGDAFLPRYSGFGAWRVQARRPDCVKGMEFLQGIGAKTGAMPLGSDLMYLFHIRPEQADLALPQREMLPAFRKRLSKFGAYVADIAAGLDEDSAIVYSPIEPLLLPWPWHRGRVVIGGDAAHTAPPHLTQGAAMAVEDALVLAREITSEDGTIDERLHRYARTRYPRCAFVYTFSSQWMADEQSVRTAADMKWIRADLVANGSVRIGVSDRLLDEPV